jgi:hypothetical protein
VRGWRRKQHSDGHDPILAIQHDDLDDRFDIRHVWGHFGSQRIVDDDSGCEWISVGLIDTLEEPAFGRFDAVLYVNFVT